MRANVGWIGAESKLGKNIGERKRGDEWKKVQRRDDVEKVEFIFKVNHPNIEARRKEISG